MSKTTVAIPSIPPGVTITTLDNGLTIIVARITMRGRFRAGLVRRRQHPRGQMARGRAVPRAGAHAVQGPTTRPGSRIDQEVQEAGGYMNAYTSFDRTVYHIDVPNTGAVKAIDILCDIMQHATLPPDELAKELDVIRAKWTWARTTPAAAPAAASSRSLTPKPYRYTIIGYLDIFNRIQPEDIRSYYTEKYAPNNVFSSSPAM